jgi:transposase-like protein
MSSQLKQAMEPGKENKRRRYRSKQEIIKLLAEFDQGNQNIKSFCASHNISSATFHSWRKRHENNSKELPAFATVKILPSAPAGLFAEVSGIKIYQPVSAAYLKDLL